MFNLAALIQQASASDRGFARNGEFPIPSTALEESGRSFDLPRRCLTDLLRTDARESLAQQVRVRGLPDAKRFRAEIEHLPSDAIGTPLEQLTCLGTIIKALKLNAIFEIGTFRGRTALQFALNAPDDAHVFTLDLLPKDRSEAQKRTNASDSASTAKGRTETDFLESDVDGKIAKFYRNSNSFDINEYYGNMATAYGDWAHDYNVVGVESENPIRLIKPGGYAI